MRRCPAVGTSVEREDHRGSRPLVVICFTPLFIIIPLLTAAFTPVGSVFTWLRPEGFSSPPQKIVTKLLKRIFEFFFLNGSN